jgi:two-component system OmpR family response regulator
VPVSHVLVVDDEEPLADLLSAGLRFAGFEVSAEYGGQAALAAIRARPPDLVVLDVNLPDVDGFEVCRRLRADGLCVPIIFLTARTDPADLRVGFSEGGDDYLTKPFSLEELTLRIGAVLRRVSGNGNANGHAGGGQQRHTCGSIMLDETAHRVTVEGREIELSPTEFRLLRYLLLNAGRVVSRYQILDFVWDYGFAGDPAIVERYVSYLRRRLGPAAGLVRTVRGVGYSLRAEV